MVLQKKQNIEQRINQKEEDNLIDKVEQVEFYHSYNPISLIPILIKNFHLNKKNVLKKQKNK